MTIGSVDVIDELYQHFLDSFSLHNINSTIRHPTYNAIPVYLWHFRLGHLSVEQIHIMQQQYPCLKNNRIFVCNTCHTKKCKLPIPISYSQTAHPFSLLHIDIWRSCSTPYMHAHSFFSHHRHTLHLVLLDAE